MTHSAQNDIRDLFLQRLTHKVHDYIEMLDALPAPKTIGDIEKSARALISLARLVNVILPAPKPVKTPVAPVLLPVEDEDDDAPADVVLNRQQRRRAEAMMRKTGP